MKFEPIGAKKLGLYVCTLLSSIFIWWVGTGLMNELTGALGTLLRLFAVALPILLVVQETRHHAKNAKQHSVPANRALVEPSMRTPLRTFLRTWRNMAIASILISGMMCVMATGLWWYAMLLIPLVCLGGPLSLLLDFDAALRVLPQAGCTLAPAPLQHLNPDAMPHVAVYVLLYGVGVAWLFWKPSSWARAVFYVLSVLWWVMGLSMASVGVDGGSSLFL
jgi:hypothetical protein